MRVLFLLSCLEPAGSETYCLALERIWGKRHQVHWISDQLHFGQRYQHMPIHLKAFPIGLINTLRVARYIRKNRIEIIHSHSRRANWVAAQAASLTGIPHITTIHQPLPVHFYSKLFPCLGRETIAIDEAVRDHLQQHFGAPREKIHLIRNGIDLAQQIPSVRQTPNIKQMLLIGRLSGGRWNSFLFFLETLKRAAKTLPQAHYRIVGQVPYSHRNEFTNVITIASAHVAPSTIEASGFATDLSVLIRNSDAAICAGRSALECLTQGRPVIFLGEGGVLGLCKPDIWPKALRTNMGDHLDPPEFNAAKLESALREVLTARGAMEDQVHWARQQIEKEYDLEKVAVRVEDVYKKALRS